MTKEERIRLWESYNSKVNKLERELLDEVMKHQTDMNNDTQQAIQFFINNEDAIVCKIKIAEKRAYRKSIIKYLKKSFPNVDVKLLNRFLIRKGYINNRKWDGNDYFTIIILTLLGLLIAILIPLHLNLNVTKLTLN